MLYNISRIFKGTKYFILFNVPIILKHLFDKKKRIQVRSVGGSLANTKNSPIRRLQCCLARSGQNESC